MTTRPLLLVALLTFLAVQLAAAGAPRPLFNGRDLSGWSIQNDGQFSVRDGMLVIDRGSGWLRSDATFADFTLVVEVRFLEAAANSGIFVRTAPTSKADEKGYPDNGYQVQCMDDTEGTWPLGSLIPYGGGLKDQSFDREAIKRAYKPTGEWNTLRISCRGDTLTIELNQVPVARATGLQNLKGHIGLQGEGGRLEFRRIELRE